MLAARGFDTRGGNADLETPLTVARWRDEAQRILNRPGSVLVLPLGKQRLREDRERRRPLVDCFERLEFCSRLTQQLLRVRRAAFVNVQ